MTDTEFSALCHEYETTIRCEIRSFRRRAGWICDIDDCRQEALIGIYIAAQQFKPSLGVQFKTFAAACIYGRLRLLFRANVLSWPVHRGRKDMAVSIFAEKLDDAVYGIPCDRAKKSVERMMDRLLLAEKFSNLNKREIKILLLHAWGFNNAEIARVCGISRQGIKYVLEHSIEKVVTNRRKRRLSANARILRESA